MNRSAADFEHHVSDLLHARAQEIDTSRRETILSSPEIFVLAERKRPLRHHQRSLVFVAACLLLVATAGAGLLLSGSPDDQIARVGEGADAGPERLDLPGVAEPEVLPPDCVIPGEDDHTNSSLPICAPSPLADRGVEPPDCAVSVVGEATDYSKPICASPLPSQGCTTEPDCEPLEAEPVIEQDPAESSDGNAPKLGDSEESYGEAKAERESVPVPAPFVVPESDTESVYGIRVHSDIAGNVKAMIEAAEADGVTLSGAGYRPTESQIAARRQNCGTSNYAIYQMPASQCSPPTAQPGTSQHEKGLAIDFLGGEGIIRRGSVEHNWLVANAARFGFYSEFEPEPWHWSTTGR